MAYQSANENTYAIDGIAVLWCVCSELGSRQLLAAFGFWFPRVSGCCFLIWIDDGGHHVRVSNLHKSNSILPLCVLDI